MQPTFTIPAPDLADFAMLPNTERDRLSKLFTALRVIHEAKNKTVAARELSALAGEQRGFSVSRLLSAYRTYSATGQWRTLVRTSHLPRPRTIHTEGSVARVSRHFGAAIRRACQS